MEGEALYWLGFQERESKPFGRVVVLGPFYSHEEAIAARQKEKQANCFVTAPILAVDTKAALEKVELECQL